MIASRKIKTILWSMIGLIFILIRLSGNVHAELADETKAAEGEIKTLLPAVEQKATLDPSIDPAVSIDQPYYQKRGEGWFWYIDPKPSGKKGDKKPEADSKPKRVEPKDFKTGWPDFKTSEDIHAYQKQLLDNAVMDPTPEKVSQYLEFQKYLMSKARLFTDVAARVTWQSPELDQSARQPRADIVRNVVYQQSQEDLRKRMAAAAKKGGIFFIFSSTCPYCRDEAPILKQFEAVYGVKIIGVTIDGGGLPEFPNPVLDRGISVTLNVNVTPTLFYGVPPKEMHRIANGFVSFDELRDRVLSVSESGGDLE